MMSFPIRCGVLLLNNMSNNLPQPQDKNDFLDMVADLRPELMYPELWSDEQQKTLDKRGRSNLRTKKAMFANIPMICAGSDCPVKQDCPLYQENNHPLGQKCPVEAQAVVDLAQSVMNSLAVDPDDLLEVSAVRTLVNQYIQYSRATGMIASEGYIIENVVGMDEVGNPVTRKELSLAVELEDKILKRISQLQKEFVATREGKVKAGIAQKDAMISLSEVLGELEAHDRKKEEILRKKLGVLDAEVLEDDDDGEDGVSVRI